MSEEKKPCVCPSLELFRYGCLCGHLDKEKAKNQYQVIMDIKEDSEDKE